MLEQMPPEWLVRLAVAGVWLYEGLWCKLLRREQRQFEIVKQVPRFGPTLGTPFLLGLGVIEVALAAWVLSGEAPVLCLVCQVLLLCSLNLNGILWARKTIHDPPGMLVKNFAFLVLAWVATSLAS